VRILGATANPHAALALCERTHPDVVLVDALLDPHCQFNRLLGAASSTAAMLCVVREPLRTTQYLTSALSAGVAGFVPRSAEPARMLEALRRTHLQRRFLDPELATLANSPGLRAVAGASSASSGAPQHHRQPLSRREHEVLGLICDGLENQEIATALFVSVETIRTHVKSILRKLRARDRAHAVALAFRLGLLVPGSADTSPTGGPATSADASVDALPSITPRSGHEHVARPSLARVTSR
jgi:DNA-binding NarL/FixJ family response regulator